MLSSKTSSSRSAGTAIFLLRPALVGADNPFELEQIFSAPDRVFQGAVGVVEQRAVGQAPLLLLLACARVDIGMETAAEAVELALQGRHIESQLARQGEDFK